MVIALQRSEIELSLRLGRATLARYIAAYGEYNNTFNSHTKGRFGEVAVHKAFSALGADCLPLYLDPTRDSDCDIVVQSAPFKRLEVKTWSEMHWEALGRCVTPAQAKRISRKADAIIWCSAPLPILNRESDLDKVETLSVTLRAYSLPADLLAAPLLYTGEAGMRKVQNYQIDENALLPIGEALRIA